MCSESRTENSSCLQWAVNSQLWLLVVMCQWSLIQLHSKDIKSQDDCCIYAVLLLKLDFIGYFQQLLGLGCIQQPLVILLQETNWRKPLLFNHIHIQHGRTNNKTKCDPRFLSQTSYLPYLIGCLWFWSVIIHKWDNFYFSEVFVFFILASQTIVWTFIGRHEQSWCHSKLKIMTIKYCI